MGESGSGTGVGGPDVVRVGEEATFTASTDPPGDESQITWTGGGDPPDGTGGSFTTKWTDPGVKTVTANYCNDSHSKDVTVLDVEITKCQPTWLPGYVNTTTITVSIFPSTVTGTITFQLSDVSCNPGYCSNAGTESSSDKDLTIEAQEGYNVSPDKQWASTQSPVSSATLAITSHDYGAYGKITGTASAMGKTIVAHVHDSTVTAVTIPLDEDGNHISDGWSHNTGGMWEDTENSPVGINQGDGFGRYDEYRGFRLAGAVTRTDPDTAKDVFVRDQDSLGLEDFTNLGLTVRAIADSEWDSATRVVNFNSTANDKQCGLRLLDGAWSVAGDFGLTENLGPPNACGWSKIYTENIRYMCGVVRDTSTWEEIDLAVKRSVIGHELGHYVGIPHHELWGTASCVMYKPCSTSSPAHTYCTSNPGCAYKSKLY